MKIPDEEWVLETAGDVVSVSWPENGDAIHELTHRLAAPRVSFGYAAVDGSRVEPLVGSEVWLAGTSGRRLRVFVGEVDPELKVAVGVVRSDSRS